MRAVSKLVFRWGVAFLWTRFLSAALPVADSFETEPAGAPPALSNGWVSGGVGQAWITHDAAQSVALIDWAAASGVGFPLPDATHTQVLVLNGAVSNIMGVADAQAQWFDFMLAPQARTEPDPPALSPRTLVAFYVTAAGDLVVARSADPALPGSNDWTVLSGAGIETGAWCRLTLCWVGGVDGAFYSVRVDGGAPLTDVSGWAEPDATADRDGPWFPCPNAALRLTPASFHGMGSALLDDWRGTIVPPVYDPAPLPKAVITPRYEPERGAMTPDEPVDAPVGGSKLFTVQALPHHHIEALLTNGTAIPHDFSASPTGFFAFTWVGVPPGWHTVEADLRPDLTPQGASIPWLLRYYPGIEDFEAAALSDIDGDGYPAWMEYLAGTDPNDPRSLFRIVDQGMADGSNYILWTSFDERGLPPFVIRRMTNLADPVWQDVGSQPRARQPVTHVWFDPASRPDAYYRLEVRDP